MMKSYDELKAEMEAIQQQMVEALIAFCREHIGGYKVPKGFDIQLEPLPKSGPGKVLKRELRAPFWASTDRSVN